MKLPQPRWRLDGVVKVTGRAEFGADFPLKDICYGVPVLSTIAKGRVVSFDVRDARRVPGLIEILTPANALPLPKKGVHPELKDAPEIEIGRASCREVWKSVCAAW